MDEYTEREAVCRAFSTDDTLSGYEKAYCREIIKKIPAADVAPVRHGQWLNFFGDFSTAECSLCSELYDVSDDDFAEEIFDWFMERYKFCPNCGAKMDGTKKEFLPENQEE